MPYDIIADPKTDLPERSLESVQGVSARQSFAFLRSEARRNSISVLAIVAIKSRPCTPHLESLFSGNINVEEMDLAMLYHEITIRVVYRASVVDVISVALNLRNGTCDRGLSDQLPAWLLVYT